MVNVILKRTFVGGSFTADAGTSQHGDGTTGHLAGIWGMGDLASDGYNGYLAIEFRHQDQITVAERSGFWTTQDWTPYGGFNTMPGASDSGFPRPRIPGGYVYTGSQRARRANVLNANTVFLNSGACAGYAAYQANKCAYNGPDQLQPQTGNLDVLGRFTKSLGGTWQDVTTASFFRSESEQVLGANDAGVSGSPVTEFGYSATALPFAVTSPRILLPAGAPNNPFGAPAFFIPEYLTQIGVPTTQYVTQTYRIFNEITGTVAGWDVDGSLGWMYSSLLQKSTGFINRNALAAAATAGFNFVTASEAMMENAFAPPEQAKDTNTMEVVDIMPRARCLICRADPSRWPSAAATTICSRTPPLPMVLRRVCRFPTLRRARRRNQQQCLCRVRRAARKGPRSRRLRPIRSLPQCRQLRNLRNSA